MRITTNTLIVLAPALFLAPGHAGRATMRRRPWALRQDEPGHAFASLRVKAGTTGADRLMTRSPVGPARSPKLVG